MAWTFNPFLGTKTKLDNKGLTSGDITTLGDARYLKLDASNDPVTGQLDIQPASGTTALTVTKDIIIKAGQKLILDGA